MSFPNPLAPFCPALSFDRFSPDSEYNDTTENRKRKPLDHWRDHCPGLSVREGSLLTDMAAPDLKVNDTVLDEPGVTVPLKL
jgi:hypothetical protein